MYNIDYGKWLELQIESLQQGLWENLDIPHLVEELEALNKSNERELESYLVVLITHLLKWEYQPTMRSGSWIGSILNSRNRIIKLFQQQPSLKSRCGKFIDEAYREAVEWASAETKIRPELFPTTSPYEISQLLDKSWLPE